MEIHHRYAFVFLWIIMIFATVGGFAEEQIDVNSEWFTDGLLRYRDSQNKWGYIDKKGNIIIEAQYTAAAQFQNGLAWVVTYPDKGYKIDMLIDTEGHTVLKSPNTQNTLYWFNHPFSYGSTICAVWKVSGKGNKARIALQGFTYLDETGKPLLKKPVVLAENFTKEGYALIGEGRTEGKGKDKETADGNRKWVSEAEITSFSFIDHAGKKLGKHTWDDARGFNNGFAAVARRSSKGNLLWGFIDIAGRIIIEPKYEQVEDFQNGLAKVALKNAKGELCWGYVNTEGKTIVEPIWVQLGDYISGLALVADGTRFEDDDKSLGLNEITRYGYIDTEGTMIIPKIFRDAYDFSEGLACAMPDEEYADYGFIDISGRFVIQPQFDEATSFKNDSAIASPGVAYGCIDKSGEWIVPPCYESIRKTSTGGFIVKEYNHSYIADENDALATVITVEKHYDDGTPVTLYLLGELPNGLKSKAYLAPDGTNLSLLAYGDRELGEHYHIVNGYGEYHLLNPDGSFAIEESFDELEEWAKDTSGLLRFEQYGDYGYLKPDGKKLTEPIFDQAGPYNEGAAVVSKGSKWYVLDADGNVLF